MQFTRLKLVGFKSFVESYELLIDEGLTGVVGPNGCGKSNLLEGLRWVMGETSYKSMRGSGMDDVIFSGTDNRPSRNVAEVVLTLDNSARTAPSAFNDSDVIEIRRRIERDKGSDYKINNYPVRAKDVQLLFADASTGSRSPALVQQGRIGEIVNAKPQSRRIILEEAAGISGLYSRRHEAELRLKSTENNLERLADIQGQLSTQLNSLKRQARQATHYKNISVEIRQTEATILFIKWQQAHAKVEKAEQTFQLALQLVGEHTSAEARLRSLQQEQSDTLNPLRESEAIAAAILQKFTIEHNNLKQEEERFEAREREIQRQHSQLQQDLERENSQIIEAEESLTALKQEQQQLTPDKDETKQQEEIKSQVTQAQKILETAEEKHSVLTDQYAQLKAQIKQAQTSLITEQNRQETLENQISDLQKTLDNLGDADALAMTADQHNEILEQSLQQFEEIDEQRLDHEFLRAEHESQRVEKQELLIIARLSAQNLETEISTLEKLLSPTGDDGNWESVLSLIEVTPGYEAALAAAFGEELDDPLEEQAHAHWKLIKTPFETPPFPDNSTSLLSVVKSPRQLQQRLRHTAIIAQDQGAEAQKNLKVGQRLVSLEGDLWRWDGYTRSEHSLSNAAKKLEERNRLAGLKEQVLEKQDILEQAETSLEEVHFALEEANATKQDLTAKWEESRAQIETHREEVQEAERALNNVRQSRASYDATQTSLQHQLKTAAEEVLRLQPLLETGREIEDLQQELDFAQDEVQTARHQFSETKALLSALQRETEQRTHRLSTINTELERWQNRHAAATAHIEELEGRFEDINEELAMLSQSPNQMADKQTQLLAKIEQAEQDRRDAADALQEAQNGLREHDKSLIQLQNDLGSARETRAHAEAKLENSREKRAELVQHIKESLNCLPENCLNSAGIAEQDNLPPLDKISAKLSKLKTDRDKLGSVNLRADQELSELEGQHETMVNDRADLEQSIAKLRSSIADLNKEGRAKLLKAFDEVNEHFKKLFTTLFNGGTSRLELIESDDPLKAGLEIIARPPGKKPQVLSLLSGGEQALTAMSLIFAVFLTNPSPICVLDEVDAPLDDANVGRFCNLLDEMNTLTDTRFLVITHHPQTMARMNRLFGVTMAEKGVSMLVSVDLEDAEKLREVG